MDRIVNIRNSFPETDLTLLSTNDAGNHFPKSEIILNQFGKTNKENLYK